MDQIHEKFLFFKRPLTNAAYLDALRAALAGIVPDIKGAPKSVSMLAEEDDITLVVGYTETDKYSVSFAICPLTGSDNDALSASMEIEAADAGDVLCHDLFRVPGESQLYALFMCHP